METSDYIAGLALLVAVMSGVISLRSLRESKRSNQIALLAHRSAVYDAFRAFSREARDAGQALAREVLIDFEQHAEAAKKYLPGDLGHEVYSYFEDCQFVVELAPRMGEADDFVKDRWHDSLQRVRHDAFAIESRILNVIRSAADDKF